jgi:hypothetical protein
VTPWTQSGGTVVGAELTLGWTDAVSIAADLPTVVFDATGDGYSDQLRYVNATNVTELEVMVDLMRGRVVSILPGETAVIRDTSLTFAAKQHAKALQAAEVIPVNGGGGPNLRRITRRLQPQVGADSFWNYDFKTDDHAPWTLEARQRVDWPISLVFWGNVDVRTAKDIWNRGFSTNIAFYLASPMYARVWDRFDPNQPVYDRPRLPVWDRDRGAYLGRPGLVFACVVDTRKWHYRVYAPAPERGGADRMYNPAWGYYVIAATHIDFKEECGDAWSGNTEAAEHKVALAAPGHTHEIEKTIWFPIPTTICEEVDDPWRVEDATTHVRQEDTLRLFNADRRGRIGRHFYMNNGMATMIRVDNISHPGDDCPR